MKETGNNKQEHRLIFKDEQGNAYEGLVSNNKVETNVLSNFLNDSKNQHKSTNGAFEKNDFLSGMLNGISSITGGNNTSNNSEINQGLDNDLSSFLEKSKQSSSNHGKSSLGSSSGFNQTDYVSSLNKSLTGKNNKNNVLDLSGFLKNSGLTSKGVSSSIIKSLIDKLTVVNRADNPNIYDDMIKSMNIKENTVIQGLDVFLAKMAEFIIKPTPLDIDVDSEILRTNFYIEAPKYLEKPDLMDSGYYINMDESLLNLPKLLELNNLFDFINGSSKIIRNKVDLKKAIDDSKIKSLNKTNKEYKVPNWAYYKDRISMDMKVKQLNRLSSQPAKKPLNGTPPKENEMVKALRKLLEFVSTPEMDKKEGFSAGGMTVEDLAKIRRDAIRIIIDKGVTTLNKRNKLMDFDKHGFVTYHVNTLGDPFVLPMLDLGNIKITKTPLGSLNGYGDIANVRDEFYHRVYNVSVEALLRKAPDFRQNMYHGIFVYTPEMTGDNLVDFSNITNFLGNNFKNDLKNGFVSTSVDKKGVAQIPEAFERILNAYYVRMQGITVPGATIDTISMDVLNRKLKKVGSSFSENHKITIDFSIDDMGLMVRGFNILTGQFSHIKDNDLYNKYADTIFPVCFSPSNKGRLDLIITYNDFRVGENLKKSRIPSKSTFTPPTQNVQSYGDMVESRNGKQVWGDPNSFRQFVLEDVRILGIGGKLQFKRDDANRVTLPLDIMFRRITTVDNNLTV